MEHPETQERPLTLQRRCPPQAAALLMALGQTLTDREDGPAIARQLGKALSTRCEPPKDDALASLESALNTTLTKLDLGVAKVSSREDALLVEVTEYPAVNAVPQHEEVVVFGLMEGLLTAYLNRLSGADGLSARLVTVPVSSNSPLCFIYANQKA